MRNVGKQCWHVQDTCGMQKVGDGQTIKGSE